MIRTINNGALAKGHLVEQAEDFITKDEVARRLKKTSRTVEKWQTRGYIPYVKVGTSIMYRWSDVMTHLEQHFRVCHRSS